jgi:hypothetical protein
MWSMNEFTPTRHCSNDSTTGSSRVDRTDPDSGVLTEHVAPPRPVAIPVYRPQAPSQRLSTTRSMTTLDADRVLIAPDGCTRYLASATVKPVSHTNPSSVLEMALVDHLGLMRLTNHLAA